MMNHNTRPRLTVFLLLCSDILALVLCNAFAIWGYLACGGQYDPEIYIRLWPCLSLFLLIYEFANLYHDSFFHPGIALGSAEELRQLCRATTLGYLLIATATFILKRGPTYSRGVFLLAWSSSLVLVPSFREWLRRWFSPRDWWGTVCVIVGEKKAGEKVFRFLCDHPKIGLKPLPHIVDPISNRKLLEQFAERGIQYAIFTSSADKDPERFRIVESYDCHFRHILLMPDLHGIHDLWFASRDLGPALGLEVRQNLLLPIPQFCKRCTDLLILAFALPFLVIPMLVLALAVKLSSRGNVIFRQERIGKNGKPFEMFKFRTMVADGEKVLQNYFRDHPEARKEWETKRKLEKDPRITPLGHLLRRSSLDELPQFWNILRGDMSLVGPRPIIASEIPAYGDVYDLYTRVRPGLTGLWQISGRNNLDFHERVTLNAQYVRKWSFWLDLLILLRTPRVILTGEGAY